MPGRCAVAAAVAVSTALLVSLALRQSAVQTDTSALRACVLVTGASSGIGLDAALSLARDEGFVVFAGVRSERDAQRLREVWQGSRPAAEAHPFAALEPVLLDVTDAQHVADVADRLQRAVDADNGECDVLQAVVNNAGINVVGPVQTVGMHDARRMFDVNVWGLLDVTRAVLPLLQRAEGRGRVVNIGSVAGFYAPPFMGPYSASKAAIEAISDSLRREVAHTGVAVSLVEPGSIRTDIMKKARSAVERSNDDVTEALYGDRLRAMLHTADELVSYAPVSWTTAAITDAVASGHPGTRYLVGIDAVGVRYLVIWLLPDQVVDFITEHVSFTMAHAHLQISRGEGGESEL